MGAIFEGSISPETRGSCAIPKYTAFRSEQVPGSWRFVLVTSVFMQQSDHPEHPFCSKGCCAQTFTYAITPSLSGDRDKHPHTSSCHSDPTDRITKVQQLSLIS